MTVVLLEGLELNGKTCVSQRQNASFAAPLGTKVTRSGNCCGEIADREPLGVSPLLPL